VIKVGFVFSTSEFLVYLYFFWFLYNYNNGLYILPQVQEIDPFKTTDLTLHNLVLKAYGELLHNDCRGLSVVL
jgi:hypothetical protein